MAAFVCTMCGACCTNLGPDQSVLLLRRDIDAIAAARATTPDAVRRDHCRLNQALSDRAMVPVWELRSANGRCVFLDAAGRCSIHEYKPTQCRIGPDRFLPGAMRQDYECMAGVGEPDDDQTADFFSQLLED